MQAIVRIPATAALAFAVPLFVAAQARNSGAPPATSHTETLIIAGHQEQAPLVRMNGRSYVDIESLARLTGASVRYNGNQIILTLPESSLGGRQGSGNGEQSGAPPQLSGPFLAAEIEALTAIREWRVLLVNAVQNNYPIADTWIAPLRRFADSKLQLAAAAASTDPDQKSLDLLRNEFANMQQQSDNLLALRGRVSEIRTDTFDNNPLDQKILACQRALAQVAASKQFHDDPSCH
jgi:hypothetical protein